MSLFNRISLKALALALPAGIFAAACGAEAPAPEVIGSPATSAAVEGAPERIDIGDDAFIEFQENQSTNLMMVSLMGPASAKQRLSELAGIREGLVALYKAALPGSEVPANVVAFDSATRSQAGASVLVDESSIPVTAELNPFEDLALGSVEKSAATFPGQFCGHKIDRRCAISGWFHKNIGCYTNATNDWSAQLNTVRQGFAALEMYRGSATLRSEYWTGSAWALAGADVSVPVNYNVSRMYWASTATPTTLRFSVINAAGDGYHVGVQTADTPIMEMPNKSEGVNKGDPPPGQRFDITCECRDAGNRIVSTPTVRACLRQPTTAVNGKEYPTYLDADTSCYFKCRENSQVTNSNNNARTTFEAVPGSSGCTVDPVRYVNR